MELLPLSISVSDQKLTSDDPALNADTGWINQKNKVFARDDHTCRYCGFRSTKWQEIQFLDGRSTNRDTDNMVTSCLFCWQVNNFTTSASRGWVRLCWIHEMSHIEINHMMRAKIVLNHWLSKLGKNASSPEVDALRMMSSSVDGAIDIRGHLVTDHIGDNSPISLSKALAQIKTNNPDAYEERGDRLIGIRAVPVWGKRENNQGKDISTEIVEHWMSEGGPYAGAMPDVWNNLLRHYNDRLNS